MTDADVVTHKVLLKRQGTLEAQALDELPDTALKEELRAIKFKRFWDAHWYFRFIGLFVAVTLIYLAGRMLGGVHRAERVRAPGEDAHPHPGDQAGLPARSNRSSR